MTDRLESVRQRLRIQQFDPLPENSHGRGGRQHLHQRLRNPRRQRLIGLAEWSGAAAQVHLAVASAADNAMVIESYKSILATHSALFVNVSSQFLDIFLPALNTA
jgi:hypothetical protein